MDGLSALTEIKNNPLLKEIPIFILYTLRKDDYTAKCRDLGVSGIYVKPGTAEELNSIFREIYTICGGLPVGRKMQQAVSFGLLNH
jgi:CheY-like chemotaxis protein